MAWAIAFNSPFALSKQVAGDFGGTRNGTIVHWPNRINKGGGVRTQFSHVNDVAPTILEAANLPMPKTINGIPQIPMQGTSLMYPFYFEIIGNRGIYHNGWMADNHVSLDGVTVAADDGWELYDTTKDFSLSNNLADQELEEAIENQVHDRLLERLVHAGRPTLLGDRTSMDLIPMPNLVEDSILNVKNVSNSVTAFVDVKGGDEDGVIFSQGVDSVDGRFTFGLPTRTTTWESWS